jgi:NAD(P)-dependent dehydrogenase (short-subunit alcohol dehydrogenase family)
MKTCLIFGAGGSIGREVAQTLFKSGNRVIASVRRPLKQPDPSRAGVIYEVLEDVADRNSMEALADRLVSEHPLDAVIYAVGHCPPDGFRDAISRPLSELPLKTYMDEVGMHQVGALNAFQCLSGMVVEGGCFVFLSSAITRLRGKFPPFLQAYHYASVIAAEDWLIEGMRHDPMTAKRRIKVHRLAPIAVDTHFHRSGPKPPRLLPIGAVVEEILHALESPVDIDKQIGEDRRVEV